MNPIVSQMNMQNPMVAMLQPIYNAMKGSQNPISILGQMAPNDNRMQQVINTIQQNGGIQQAVYAEARSRNINPTDALNQAQQILNTFNMR